MGTTSTFCCGVLLFVCLFQMPDTSSAFHKRKSMRKGFRVQRKSGGLSNTLVRETPRHVQFDTDASMGPYTNGTEYQSVALHCRAMGSPPPVIHWLKNGKPIQQKNCADGGDEVKDREGKSGSSDGWLRIGGTKSTLFVDCLEADDEAEYTCVAETSTLRESLSTKLRVVPAINHNLETLRRCAKKGSPARIYMSTRSRLEYLDNTVQLLCRAHGNPKPKITWYDGYNNTIQDGGKFKVMPEGDLVISHISWEEHMGVYTCVASNKYGSDMADPFLYPTLTSSGGGWPFGTL